MGVVSERGKKGVTDAQYKVGIITLDGVKNLGIWCPFLPHAGGHYEEGEKKKDWVRGERVGAVVSDAALGGAWTELKPFLWHNVTPSVTDGEWPQRSGVITSSRSGLFSSAIVLDVVMSETLPINAVARANGVRLMIFFPFLSNSHSITLSFL
jgi:hypothetical protein